jgi:hypothetical protein
MRKTYKLELDVTLDEADERMAVQVAREHYRATGGAQVPLDDDGERWREIPAEEFVADPLDAIMVLLHGDPLCDQAGIQVNTMPCTEAEIEDSCVKAGENGPAVPDLQMSESTAPNAA